MKTLLVSAFSLLVTVGCTGGTLFPIVEPIEITINVTNCEIIEVVDKGCCMKCDVETIYNNKNQGTVEVVMPIPKGAVDKIGGDKDGHNCLISAGYQWSEEKQKCIRIWEQ